MRRYLTTDAIATEASHSTEEVGVQAEITYAMIHNHFLKERGSAGWRVLSGRVYVPRAPKGHCSYELRAVPMP